MIRLVQIEGLPASHELYSPNSAYVDVQLKYIGNPATPFAAVQKPPRLDICLQEVYYFIISVQQMMSHSVEFQINTFDEEYRRFVSGLVEVNLYEEMGEDILSGSEVVFVKDILEPFKVTFNPFCTTGIFLYLLKTLENCRFSDIFRGYRKRPVT